MVCACDQFRFSWGQKENNGDAKGEGRWKNDDDDFLVFSSARVSSGPHLCVCVCVSTFVAADSPLPPLPSSIGTKFRRPPVDSHPHHHPFKIRLRPSPKRKTPEREKHQENFVCVCVSRVGHSNSLPKSIPPLSLSPHLFNLLWQVVVVARSLACDKKKDLKGWRRKKGKMCAALNPPPLSLLFTCC